MNTLQLQVLMLIFAGWVNRSQQNVIEHLQEENRVLREQLGHAHPQVTARHYARWLGEEYREPMTVRAGEVPADLLSRLGETTGHHAATRGHQENA